MGSDSNQRTITLNHHSGIKSLCETFKLEDQPTFEKYVEWKGGRGERKGGRGRGGETRAN